MIREWDRPLNALQTLLFALAAIVSFHLAYLGRHCEFLMILFLYCLFHLANVASARRAFYTGLGVGLAAYVPHLLFFWTIFDRGAIALWLILPAWLGLFLLLGRVCLSQWGLLGWALAAPFFWTGLEYFRSELYYLRFSWLNPGYAFSNSPALFYLSGLGVYGIGFLLMIMAVILALARRVGWRFRLAAGAGGAAVVCLALAAGARQPYSQNSLRVTGVQFEMPYVAQVISGLNEAVKEFPETDLLVLGEYTFAGPIPRFINDWCRKHRKYLAVGAEDPIIGGQYYNTVFVINPSGEVAFQQVKCVPVQFMNDGLAAAKQTVWDSPWGRLGFGLCYDASYTRVMDELVRQGAQALIIPTMDAADWGLREHEMHARIAPVRAAEYDLPIFRLCSSGISQAVDPVGRVVATAPYPGPGAIMSALMQLPLGGRIPMDRRLAWVSVGATILGAGLMLIEHSRRRLVESIMQSK